MTASVNITAFWDIASCSLFEVDRRFRGAYCLHHYPHVNRGSTYLWNFSLLEQNYTVLYSRSLSSSQKLCLYPNNYCYMFKLRTKVHKSQPYLFTSIPHSSSIGKAIPQRAYGGEGGRGCIAPTHSRPRQSSRTGYRFSPWNATLALSFIARPESKHRDMTCANRTLVKVCW
jgi:hypothetical protein